MGFKDHVGVGRDPQTTIQELIDNAPDYLKFLVVKKVIEVQSLVLDSLLYKLGYRFPVPKHAAFWAEEDYFDDDIPF